MGFFVEDSFGVFLLLTVILGGGAAFMSGRSVAKSWGSLKILAFYMLVLTAAVRFMHFALFNGDLFSLEYYISHGIILFLSAYLGFRARMAEQMVRQYPWLYENSGFLGWKERQQK